MVCCIVCALLAALLAVANLFINRFVHLTDALRCLPDFYPEEKRAKLFIMSATFLFVLVPLLTTIVVYGIILQTVSRNRNRFGQGQSSQSWQAIKTTLLVVGVYLLSALPFVVTRLVTLATTTFPPLRLRIFNTVVYLVNTAVNPYVYLLTNKSLKRHSKQRLSVSNMSRAATSRRASLVAAQSKTRKYNVTSPSFGSTLTLDGITYGPPNAKRNIRKGWE